MVQLGWYREGAIPGTKPRPVLRLIQGILDISQFIRPFDWLFMEYYQDLRYWDPGPGSGPGSGTWILVLDRPQTGPNWL